MADYLPEMWLNRTLCDVLEEMRTCCKTLNFAPILSLIEEAQMMGNRMEASLSNVSDLSAAEENYYNMRKKYKKLKADVKSAERWLEEVEIEVKRHNRT